LKSLIAEPSSVPDLASRSAERRARKPVLSNTAGEEVGLPPTGNSEQYLEAAAIRKFEEGSADLSGPSAPNWSRLQADKFKITHGVQGDDASPRLATRRVSIARRYTINFGSKEELFRERLRVGVEAKIPPRARLSLSMKTPEARQKPAGSDHSVDVGL